MIALLLIAVAQDTARLGLRQAIAAAERSYPSIVAARAGEDRAAADIGSARSALLPHLRIDASATRFQEPMIVYPLHAFSFMQPPVFDRTLIQPGASVSYTLYDFGARGAQVAAARAGASAAATRTVSAEQDVIGRTVSAYLDVATARQLTAADDDELTALRAEADRARKFFAAGTAAQLDVLRGESAVQQAVAQRSTDGAAADLAERELARVTGLSLSLVHTSRLDTLRFAADSGSASGLRDTVTAAALAANQDVVAARSRVAVAAARVAAARALRWPSLQATGAWLAPGSIDGNFHPDWQLGVAMSYAIYSGGATSSAIDAAQADLAAARADLQTITLGVGAAVDQALAALSDAAARITALRQAETQSAEVLRIETLSRDVGEGTQTDYLAAAADLLHARAALTQARQAAVAARVALAQLAGELTPAWIAHNVESAP